MQDNNNNKAKGVDRRYADIFNEENVRRISKGLGCDRKTAIGILKIIKRYPKREGEDKLIDELSEYLKKYNETDNNHLSSIEIKADRYAANRTSERAMKTALKRLLKKANSKDAMANMRAACDIADIQNDKQQRIYYDKLSEDEKKKEYKELTKQYKHDMSKYLKKNKDDINDCRKQQKEDYRIRADALKDPYLRKAKPLKPGY